LISGEVHHCSPPGATSGLNEQYFIVTVGRVGVSDQEAVRRGQWIAPPRETIAAVGTPAPLPISSVEVKNRGPARQSKHFVSIVTIEVSYYQVIPIGVNTISG
jgi:hypothetical protein